MNPSSFNSNYWTPAKRAAGLEGVRFHDLGHTAVALAIAQGAHPKAIQMRMGHSSVQVTLDRYGHLFPELNGQIASGSTPRTGARCGSSRAVSRTPEDTKDTRRTQNPGI